jgi:hypothetical protein
MVVVVRLREQHLPRLLLAIVGRRLEQLVVLVRLLEVGGAHHRVLHIPRHAYGPHRSANFVPMRTVSDRLEREGVRRGRPGRQHMLLRIGRLQLAQLDLGRDVQGGDELGAYAGAAAITAWERAPLLPLLLFFHHLLLHLILI